MDNFFELVYKIVETIPEGKVVSYVQIARALGKPRGARAVGYAMRVAPSNRNLPCHRVVNQKGSLAPSHVFGDEQMQRLRLESEGVLFLLNGFIDMKQSQWKDL